MNGTRVEGVTQLKRVCTRGQHASGTTLLQPAQHTHHCISPVVIIPRRLSPIFMLHGFGLPAVSRLLWPVGEAGDCLCFEVLFTQCSCCSCTVPGSNCSPL
jgi:hypothetical protein